MNKAQRECIKQWTEWPETITQPEHLIQFLEEYNAIDPAPDPEYKEFDVRMARMANNFIIYINGEWQEFCILPGNQVVKSSGNSDKERLDEFFYKEVVT